MSAETCRKIKAVLFITILAVAEARQVQQRAQTTNYVFQTYGQSAAGQNSVNALNAQRQVEDSMSKLVDKFVDNLSHRAMMAPLHPLTNLESTTFGKAPKATLQHRMVPSLASAGSLLHSRSHPAPQLAVFNPSARGLQLRTSTKSSRMPVASIVQGGRGTAETPKHAAIPAWALMTPAFLAPFAIAGQALASEGSTIMGSSVFTTIAAVSLVLVPGFATLLRRAPDPKIISKTFEIKGPAAGGKNVSSIAREVATYFISYAYSVEGTGEVISFKGSFQEKPGQLSANRLTEAALRLSLTFAAFVGLAFLAQVLSVEVPEVGGVQIGSYWFLLVLLSPLAWKYYVNQGTRDSEVTAKLVVAEDEKLVDLIIEGDQKEIRRFQGKLKLKTKRT